MNNLQIEGPRALVQEPRGARLRVPSTDVQIAPRHCGAAERSCPIPAACRTPRSGAGPAAIRRRTSSRSPGPRHVGRPSITTSAPVARSALTTPLVAASHRVPAGWSARSCRAPSRDRPRRHTAARCAPRPPGYEDTSPDGSRRTAGTSDCRVRGTARPRGRGVPGGRRILTARRARAISSSPLPASSSRTRSFASTSAPDVHQAAPQLMAA